MTANAQDPMLGQATSSEHIVVGVSSHPRAVKPVSGTFFDEDNSYLGMQVTVQTSPFAEFEAFPVSLAAVGEKSAVTRSMWHHSIALLPLADKAPSPILP
jgi:hypothetical protein